MRKNIFLKSVMRQPVRTLLLVVLIGIAAFALVARVTEFVVVRGELTRIEGFYRSVGILSPLRFNDFTTDHDVTRALDIIENNRHVAISDTRRFTQGVFADRLNTVTQYRENYFNPGMYDTDIQVMDHYFIGSLAITPNIVTRDNHSVIRALLIIEELLIGSPITLPEEDLFTNQFGQTNVRRSRHMMNLRVTNDEAALFRQGLWCPFDGLEPGERALFRATPYVGVNVGDPWQGFMWYIRAVSGDDGFMLAPEYNPREFGGYYPRFSINRSDRQDVTFFVRESDTAGMYAVLTELEDEFALLAENLSSVTVIETRDMTAMPRFADRRVTRLLDTSLFPAGRWLNYEDYGQPVAVVPAQLAIRSGLRVGETFTITLRDNPRPTWIDNPTTSVWARGVENWWDNNPQGWWGMVDSAHQDWRDFPTYELTMEVVGVYWFDPPFFTNFTSAEIFIPAGVMPEGFGWDDMPQLTGMYSFVLDSPRSQETFLRQTRAALAELGFVAVFSPNGFDALAAVTDPIHFAITVNLIVFGAAAFMILTLVIFLYIRQWRKSVAIAQALGISSSTVLRQLFVPIIILWLPAVAIGSVLAWFFALTQAQVALDILAGYEAEALLAPYWLGVFIVSIIAFILVGVQLMGHFIVHSPVLEQLQGGTQKRGKVKHIAPGVVPHDFVVGTFTLEPVVTNARAARIAPWKHSLRHIIRTPVKTLLILVLSTLLVFSLGWLNNTINFTEAEIERLWEETIVEAEIIRNFEHDSRIVLPANISPSVWDLIEYSGFVGDSYLEVVYFDVQFIFLEASHLPGFVAENTKTITDEQLGAICEDMEIEFMPGFSAEDFVFTEDAPISVVVRRGMAEALEIGGAQVIGVFDGGLARAVNRFGEESPMVVMPIGAYQFLFAETLPPCCLGPRPYMTARFTIDPTRNHEIEQFRELVEPFVRENNVAGFNVPLILLMDDDVLYNVILPMEQNLELLKILYPIAIALAFVLAVGITLLTMLQNAQNAAIMRALGKPKTKTQFMLSVEQVITCVFGVLLGLGLLFIVGITLEVTPFALTGIYIGGIVIGSVTGAFLICAKTPIELLQVRE